MSMNSKQKHDLKKFIAELAKHRGRHTELVSVYIPAGYDIVKIQQHLAQEQGTASNIKSTSTRKNVQDALEKMIQHLKIYTKTPENGLAAFSGNVAEREGQSDVKVWSIEPSVPLNTRIYRCDKTFVVDLLQDMMETKEVYGLVVMDRREANIAYLKGKSIIPLAQATSNVPGKTRAGGQCLLKDSFVQLADGKLKKIQELHNPNKVKAVCGKLTDIDNMGKLFDSNIVDVWNVKKNKTYTIITKNPRTEVSCSKDHVFFVTTDDGIIEKKADNLRKGDKLIMPEKIMIAGKNHRISSKKYYNSFIINKEGSELLRKKRELKGFLQRDVARITGLTQTCISTIELGKRNVGREILKKICNYYGIKFENFIDKFAEPYLYNDNRIILPVKLDETLSQILGYLVGDGCIEEDRLSFFEQSKDVAEYYKRLFERKFNVKVGIRFRKEKNYYQLRITSRPLVRLIRSEFPEIKRAGSSLIPEKILTSNNKIVAGFLRGLFDAEGYSSGAKVAIGMNNKQLMQQLHMLLLRFSIIGSFQEYDNRCNKYSDNHRYTEEISEKKSIQLFKKYIGFNAESKANSVDKILSDKSDTSYSRQLMFPGTLIREIIEKSGENIRTCSKVSSFFYNDRRMSKAIFKKSILNIMKGKKCYNKLKEIYDFELLPVEVNHIRQRNETTEMTDIAVRNQNFIVNGIITHNSAARYMRLREDAAKDFYKKVASLVKESFFENRENLKGILVGGPGPTKYDFVDGDFITQDLKKKIITIKDLSYTDEFGLQELVEKSEDVLANEEISDEKKIMRQFFEKLSTEPGKISYGEKEVKRILEMGAVEVLLLSESLSDEKIDEFEEIAETLGTTIKIISTETREGVQLKDMGGFGAILRYELRE